MSIYRTYELSYAIMKYMVYLLMSKSLLFIKDIERNNMLIELIRSSKQNDETATLLLIEQFKPLIKKYSKKFFFDDYESFFIIVLLSAIEKINIEDIDINDAKIVSYFSKVIRNAYIDEVKNKINDNLFELTELTYEINEAINKNNEFENVDFKIYLDQITESFSKSEKRVIVELFVNNKCESDLAAELSISKQAISNAKRKAFKKMKIIIEEN